MHAESKTRADRRANRMHDDRTFRNKKPTSFRREFCPSIVIGNAVRGSLFPHPAMHKNSAKILSVFTPGMQPTPSFLVHNPPHSGLMRNAAQFIGRQRRFVLSWRSIFGIVFTLHQ
ncbi:hypothetical protein [Gluconacetobacter liquefaciens]|uniref:hypothetical protein n=1 Tax=Gluconacetobacter liquefaciens TaxID=89584 RepID=UPI001476C42A|nr:hypothetical protein [Gluconacetobacter liquefaciens]